MTGGKFLGRSTSLWVALIAAGVNLLVALNAVTLTAEQIAAINAFALIAFGILANEENPTTAGTFEPTTKAPDVKVTDA